MCRNSGSWLDSKCWYTNKTKINNVTENELVHGVPNFSFIKWELSLVYSQKFVQDTWNVFIFVYYHSNERKISTLTNLYMLLNQYAVPK